MGKKPIFLLPCIFAYRLVLSLIHFVKYVFLGMFIVLYSATIVLTTVLFRMIHYVLGGFLIVCWVVYQLVNFVTIKVPVNAIIGVTFILFAITSFFKMIGRFFSKYFLKLFDVIYGSFTKNKKVKEKNKKEPISKPEPIKEEKVTDKKLTRAEKRRMKREQDVFINDKEIEEKVTFKEKLNNFFKAIASLPSKFVQSLKNRYQRSSVINYISNKKALENQELLLNFDGEDAEKSETKILYEYRAKNEEGKVVKGYFEAFSKVEVHSYLLSENMTVYSIRTNQWITFLHKNEASTRHKIKSKDLIFFLTQLSTYLKAGITLIEALKILSRQYKGKRYKKIFTTIVYDLTMGDNFSEALEKQGEAFPRLLINMVKTSEMTGELPEVLDDMADHFTKIDKTKKEMVNALMYPCLVFVFAIGVIIFIMLFVIPRFVEIYESMDSSAIPGFTKMIMNISAFLQNHFFTLAAVIVIIIIILFQLYKRVQTFRTAMQWMAMHMPAFGNVIIYNEVTMFTKTLASLSKHNVFITQSMDILKKMTNNEIYKMLIINTVTNLGKGDKISDAFKGQWAFPVPAYEMLVTGEKTGELPEMMEKVANYYQTLQESSVARIKTFIEPILIVFLTTIVGAIVLAIIIPMFNMYNAIQ